MIKRPFSTPSSPFTTRWRGWLLSLLACLALTACSTPLPECTDPLGCILVRPDAAIRIAYVLPLTGAAAPAGEEILQAINLAIANSSASLAGHPLELAGFDAACSAEIGRRTAERLAADTQLVGIIGPGCSAVAQAMANNVAAAGLLMVSPMTTAVSPMLGTSLPGDAFFRTIPDNQMQAEAAAAFARARLRATTAVVIQDETVYSQQLAQHFAQSFQQQGGRILFKTTLTAGQTDLDPLLAALNNELPDLLYMALLPPQANLLLNRLLESNTPEALAVLGNDTLLSPAFISSTGAAADGLYITATAVSSEAYDQFLAQWQATNGSLPSGAWHLYAYDATNLLLEAIAQTAVSNGRGALLIGRQALRQAIGDTAQYGGLSGVLTCTPSGSCADRSSLGIYQLTNAEISGGRWPPQVVWP